MDPAYYQTDGSGALRGGPGGAALGRLQARVRHLRHGSRWRSTPGSSERTRIARDLHDTLLQSFHGLLLRFQTASHLLPDHPAEAKERLDAAIAQAARAIAEGRDAVQGLRDSTVEGNDLARAISTLGQELAAAPGQDRPRARLRRHRRGDAAPPAPDPPRRGLQDHG